MSVEESFNITVLHQGVKMELAGVLRISAYTHQFLFKIGDTEIILERDDEGKFRALIPSAPPESGQKTDPSLSRPKIDPSLIQTLMKEMEKIMNT